MQLSNKPLPKQDIQLLHDNKPSKRERYRVRLNKTNFPSNSFLQHKVERGNLNGALQMKK